MTRKNHLLKIKEICNTPILYDFRPEKLVLLTALLSMTRKSSNGFHWGRAILKNLDSL